MENEHTHHIHTNSNEMRSLIKKEKIKEEEDNDNESTARKIVVKKQKPPVLNSPEREEFETAKNNANNIDTFSLGKMSSIKNKTHLKIEFTTDKNSNFKSPKNSEKINISSTEKENISEEVTINKSKVKQTRNVFDRQEAETSFALCFICDKFIQKIQTYQADTCNHIFCRKCGKLFYEDKIEQGETEFTCPIFKCQSKVSKDTIKALVSAQHYATLLYEKKNETKFKNVIKQNVEQKLKLQDKIDNVKLYIKPHVLDVNTNEIFYMFNKAKIQFCPRCGENALFSKSGNHFIKCLNCFHTICKYCLKNYDVLHMDIGTADHCKVYYRKNDKYDKSMEYWKLYLIQLFLVIASYIMIYIGTYKYISIGVNKMFCMSKIRKGKSICLIFVIAVNIILFIIAIPFIVIAFPYFPIVVEATG